MQQIQNNTETRERVAILRKEDLEFSVFCGSGAGGQARNKVHSGSMIRHPESGAMAKASDSRSLEDNKQTAFKRLLATPQMKFWLAKRIYEVNHESSLEQESIDSMTDKNIKQEVRGEDGKWKEVTSDYFDSETAKEEVCPTTH